MDNENKTNKLPTTTPADEPKIYQPGDAYSEPEKDNPTETAPKVIDGDFTEVHSGEDLPATQGEIAPVPVGQDSDHDGIEKGGMPDDDQADDDLKQKNIGVQPTPTDGLVDKPVEEPEKPEEPDKKHESLLISAIKGGLAGAGLSGLNNVFGDHDEAINKENHDARIEYNEKMADYKQAQNEQAGHERDYQDIKNDDLAKLGRERMTDMGFQGNRASDQTARDFERGREVADAKNARRDGMFGVKRNFLDKVDRMRGINPNEYTINTSTGQQFAYNPKTLQGGDHRLADGNYAKTRNGYTGHSHLNRDDD